MILFMYLFYAIVGTAGLVLAVLLGVLVLQLAGVLKRVPFNYNLRNLVLRWRTTLLTALAFTLVVALMTVMGAFVNGMYRLTKNSGVPGNVIVLANGATDELFSTLGFGREIKNIELRDEVVKDEDGNRLASWEIYVVVNQPIAVRKCPVCKKLIRVDNLGERLIEHDCPGGGTNVMGSRGRRFVQVRGVDDPVLSGRVHQLGLHEGGAWFSSSGVQPVPGSTQGEQAIQAVIGEGLARELGPDLDKKALEVGDFFELGPRKWIVVGIMKSSGSTFDSEVWAKLATIGEQFGKNSYTTCVLRTADEEAAKAFATDLSKNYKLAAVAAQTETEYYEKLNTTNQQFLYAIIVVVAIMAIGGVFGVMNTMFAAISQRTKDIGVMRIIGYARWQVLVSFFMEAMALALIGGLLGCALGSLCHGVSASSNMASGAGGGKSVMLKLVVDLRILGVGMVFSLLMGYIGGLVPALSAMRLKPLESVR